MSEAEFEVLDELYFVMSFGQLSSVVEMDDGMLKETLEGLLKKGWVECFTSPNDTAGVQPVHFEKEYAKYYYLATKAGLLAHNSNL